MRAVILGFGNDILGDDAVGLRVAAAVAARLALPVTACSIFGLDVPAHLEGFDAAFIIDALESADAAPGELRRFALAEFRGCRHLCSPHSTDFSGGIAFARALGLAMPERIAIYGVAIRPVRDFSDRLSLELTECLPRVVERLAADAAELLAAWRRGEQPALTRLLDPPR